DARVEEVVGEADPVAQQRALGERRARVDREDRDLALLPARVLDEPADQRGLAHARRPGEAHDRRAPGLRVDLAHERPALRVVVLDQRDRARQRTLVAREQALGEIGGGASRARHGRELYGATPRTSNTRTDRAMCRGAVGEWDQERCRCGAQPSRGLQTDGWPWLKSPFQPTHRNGRRGWFWRGSAQRASRDTSSQVPPGPGRMSTASPSGCSPNGSWPIV